MTKDQNGRKLYRNVASEPDGASWGVNVWTGDGLNARRNQYRTREEARNGNIGDDRRHGLVGITQYRSGR